MDDATSSRGLNHCVERGTLESGPVAAHWTKILVSTACSSVHVPGLSVHSHHPGVTGAQTWQRVLLDSTSLAHSQSAPRPVDFHLYSHCLGPGPPPTTPKTHVQAQPVPAVNPAHPQGQALYQDHRG